MPGYHYDGAHQRRSNNRPIGPHYCTTGTTPTYIAYPHTIHHSSSNLSPNEALFCIGILLGIGGIGTISRFSYIRYIDPREAASLLITSIVLFGLTAITIGAAICLCATPSSKITNESYAPSAPPPYQGNQQS
jgi:hypothetical protein